MLTRFALSQVRHLEEERNAAVATKEALLSKVAALEAAVEGDARLVMVKKDLDAERVRAAEASAKLALAQGESATFRRRLEQLEGGAKTEAELRLNREGEWYSSRLQSLESRAASLQRVRGARRLLASSSRWSPR